MPLTDVFAVPSAGTWRTVVVEPLMVMVAPRVTDPGVVTEGDVVLVEPVTDPPIV